MYGTKATFLEMHARRRGHPFVRFDYRGHGASDGKFEDTCLGDWCAPLWALVRMRGVSVPLKAHSAQRRPCPVLCRSLLSRSGDAAASSDMVSVSGLQELVDVRVESSDLPSAAGPGVTHICCGVSGRYLA